MGKQAFRPREGEKKAVGGNTTRWAKFLIKWLRLETWAGPHWMGKPLVRKKSEKGKKTSLKKKNQNKNEPDIPREHGGTPISLPTRSRGSSQNKAKKSTGTWSSTNTARRPKTTRQAKRKKLGHLKR